jgi:hypothetical protein
MPRNERPALTESGVVVMRRALLIPLALVLAFAVFAGSAQAALQIEEFETTTSTSLAGGHPDLFTHFKLKSEGEVAKNVTFNTPEGLFGNPSVATQCTSLDFALEQCPSDAQVGLITVRADYEGDPNFLLGTAPIYRVEPGSDEAARFAFIVPTINIPIAIPVTVRSGSDYGLRFTVSGITQAVPLSEANLTFWGFPASESHVYPDRFPKGSPGHPAGCPGQADAYCHFIPTQANIPALPFTGNGSVCGTPMPTTLDVETYQRPGALAHADASYPPITNCERQTFSPVAQGRLTSPDADSASGLDLVLQAPQAQGFAASPSMLRSAILTLPDELTINPDAADGQSSCSDAQAGFGREGASACPDNSKVGTVDIHSAALPGDLEGSIYLGEPEPGNQYRLFMLAEGFGIHAKFVGKLVPDPSTGKLQAEFNDLPQLPFDQFDLHIFASDRGILATPTHCAVYAVQSRLFPWNDQLPDQRAQFGVGVTQGPGGKGCPAGIRPFNPKLEAGTNNSSAGSFSNFTLKLDREDGDQYLKDLGFTMPPGLTGSLRGITYCPDAAIASASQKLGRTEQAIPSCPSSSEIGNANVAAGPGSHPFHAVGKMYMAGPFKGAPLSLVAITPALAGPYDYGTVVVRVAVDVDSLDAHVTAISDTVPSIIGGIPLRLRSIQVNLDRQNFILNPTNCQPMAVDSKGIGDQGTTTAFSSYFQAANCAQLPFKPQMTIRQIGKGTTRSKNPSLEFHLRTRPGDANIKSVAVTLSKAFAIDQRHLGNICSETELLKTRCAGKAAIGTAITRTPLLDAPLAGPAYAVSGKGGLPRLAFVLNGQVTLIPRGKSSSVDKGALKTVIPTVPDAPIGDFALTLFGVGKGYLINTRSLCARPVVTTVDYVAQNGRKLSQDVKAKAACGKSKAKKKRPGA